MCKWLEYAAISPTELMGQPGSSWAAIGDLRRDPVCCPAALRPQRRQGGEVRRVCSCSVLLGRLGGCCTALVDWELKPGLKSHASPDLNRLFQYFMTVPPISPLPTRSAKNLWHMSAKNCGISTIPQGSILLSLPPSLVWTTQHRIAQDLADQHT